MDYGVGFSIEQNLGNAYLCLEPSDYPSRPFRLLAAIYPPRVRRRPHSKLVHGVCLVVEDVIKKRRSVRVRFLTCFLGRACPIESVSTVEVMVLQGKTRVVRDIGVILWFYRVGKGHVNGIGDGGDLGSRSGTTGLLSPRV